MCIDFVVLCFAMLLAFAVRFDPASLEQQFRIWSDGIWGLIAVQILAHFPLKKELTEPPQPAQVWTRWILPLTAAAIGLSFSGQALAFFYQLYKGEPPTEE